jgi:hypothetical protein
VRRVVGGWVPFFFGRPVRQIELVLLLLLLVRSRRPSGRPAIRHVRQSFEKKKLSNEKVRVVHLSRDVSREAWNHYYYFVPLVIYPC